jgi:hypothetical protein
VNVFVETNLVLELALEQQEAPACDELVQLAEQGAIRLLLPAYSLVEPYETLTRRWLDRRALRQRLSRELTQIARSASLTDRVAASQDVVNLLVDSEQREARRIEQTKSRICKIADVLALDDGVLAYTETWQMVFNMSPQDAVIYASIRKRLEADHAAPSCFVSRNPRDFNGPELKQDLAKFNCKYFSSFAVALQYIRHAIGV